MQIDMHFYGTYAIARAAGLPPQVAKTVATAAQFVDDAVSEDSVTLFDGTEVEPVESCHELYDPENFWPADQWKVWMPYHFLPGNVGDSDEERLLCRPGRPGNPATDAVIDFALRQKEEPFGPHLLGITSHVLEDTFSHYGFSGVSSDYNKADQLSFLYDIKDGTIFDHVKHKVDLQNQKIAGQGGELARMGHGAVGELPDRPYLLWSFDYEADLADCPRQEQTKTSKRDNRATFFEAVERLYGVFRSFAENHTLVPEPLRFCPLSGIEGALRTIIAFEGTNEDRSDKWLEAIMKGRLFDRVHRVETEDFISYSKTAWSPATLEAMPDPRASDAYRFIQASTAYRGFVLDDLIPNRLGLTPA